MDWQRRTGTPDFFDRGPGTINQRLSGGGRGDRSRDQGSTVANAVAPRRKRGRIYRDPSELFVNLTSSKADCGRDREFSFPFRSDCPGRTWKSCPGSDRSKRKDHPARPRGARSVFAQWLVAAAGEKDLLWPGLL